MATTKKTYVFADAADKNVCGVIYYGKTADHKLYLEADYKTQITQAQLEDAFKKGQVLIYDGTSYMIPVSITGNKAVTVAGTTSVAGTEWTAKAE